MSEMVELAARALWDCSQKRFFARSAPSLNPEMAPWEHLVEVAPFTADEFRQSARAAISAMREPTEGMLAAANALATPSEAWGDYHAPLEKVWQAMIDAALRE